MDNLTIIKENVTDVCLEQTWFNSDQLAGELNLCPGSTNSSEDDFNTFYFYQVKNKGLPAYYIASDWTRGSTKNHQKYNKTMGKKFHRFWVWLRVQYKGANHPRRTIVGDWSWLSSNAHSDASELQDFYSCQIKVLRKMKMSAMLY